MKWMTSIFIVAFAGGALAQSGTKIAGVVSVTRVCSGGGGAARPPGAEPRPTINDVSVALEPQTFETYLKPVGGGLVFHFYPMRDKVRGAEIKFTVAAPSTNAKPGFEVGPKWAALRAEPLEYELVITDLKGEQESKAYLFTLKTCVPIP